MPEHDPPIEPLHRLDPTEPDEETLRSLQRIDPHAEEPSGATTGPAAAATSQAARRPRDGAAAAIGLATLLSLSSIGAIGGLVAVSSGTLSPEAAVAPATELETTAPLPVIRLEEPGRAKDRREPAEPSVEEVAAPAPVVAEQAPEPAANGGRDEPGPAGGKSLKPAVGGAWCDATPGTSCDATPTGSRGTIVETEGYVQVSDDDDKDGGRHPPHGHGSHG